jgi:SPP1 gp7 family putative phage head morphogenesis protein
MIAAYSTPTPTRYVALWPRREMGPDLALALLATGQHSLSLAPPGFATIDGEHCLACKSTTIEGARLEAIGLACSNGAVELVERVGEPGAHLFVHRERVRLSDQRPAGGQLIGFRGTVVKAANVRSPMEFRRIIGTLSGQLSWADRQLTEPTLTKALQKLDLSWSKLSSADIKKVFDTFNKTLKELGVSKVIPSYAQKVTLTATTVADGARQKIRESFLPRIGASLTSPDQTAIRQIGVQQGWFLRDEFGQRSDAVTEAGRKVVQDGLAAGLGTYEIGADLMKQVPGMWSARGKAYANTVASNALTRARTYSELSAYTEAGIQMLEIVAMLDDRTTTCCRALDGMCIPVDGAMGIATAAMQIQNPEDVRSVAPFVRQKGNELFGAGGKRIATIERSGIGNADDRGQVRYDLMGGQLLSAKIGCPPFHFGCRSMTVPRTQMVQVPRNYEARSLGTVGGMQARTPEEAALFQNGTTPVEVFAAPKRGQSVLSGSPFVPTVPPTVGLYQPTPLSEYERRALWSTGLEAEGMITSRSLVTIPGGAPFLDVSTTQGGEVRRSLVRVHPEDAEHLTRSLGAVKQLGAGRPVALAPAEKYLVPVAGKRGRIDYEMLALQESEVRGAWVQRSWPAGKSLMVEVTNSATVKTVRIPVAAGDLERVKASESGLKPKKRRST